MTTTQIHPSPPSSKPHVTTLGVVSYLNAVPLYQKLLGDPSICILPAVPAKLADLLATNHCDCALLPVVDYWRRKDTLVPISDGCIASDGETLTVRVFSRVPPDQIQTLWVDGESHTSIILASVIWQELYGRKLQVTQWNRGQTTDPEAILLIGDKVICEAPRGLGFQVDLGAAWKHLTGLPFVFAAWYGPGNSDTPELARILAGARDAGVADAEQLAIDAAAHHLWPLPIAVEYLSHIMKYTITAAMRESMSRFFNLAQQHGLLP